MKKFLIVLAMVVTASLLMGAGCFTVNTPPIITTLALPDATVGTAYTTIVGATDADGDALTFSVSGPTGMVISGAGVISGWTPTESGTENVAVAVTDGTDLVSANFTITVEAAPAVPVAVTGVTLDEATLALTVGDAAVTLVATVAPATATDTSVIWASSEETVAIVALGVVTPLNAGISAITVTTVDGGFVATCVLTVTAADEPEPPASTTPTILDIQKSDGVTSIVDLTSTATQYINKTEAGTSILVTGIAGPEALVKVYIGSAATPVAVGESATTGLFSVAVTEIALGADSLVAKTLHATSTELGLDESVASNVATFILDTDLPGIDSVAFTADSTVTAADLSLTTALSDLVTTVTESETTVPVQAIEAGKWVIASLADSGVANNILVTSPSGTGTFYNVSDSAVVTDTMIPGIVLTFGPILGATGDTSVTITITTAALATVAGRATLKFDEDVTYAGAIAGTYAGDLVAADPYAYKETNNTGYWTDLTIAAGTTYTINVYGITDLAGNVGGTSAVPLTKSAAAGVASATLLKP